MLHMNLIKKFKTSFQIKFSNDYRFLCHLMGSKTIVYDSNSWEKIAELSKPKNPSCIQFSQNNDYLYIKNTIGTICMYDTSEFQLIKTIKSNKKVHFVEGDFALTNAPFTILDTLKTKCGNQLALVNIDSGEYKILTDFDDSITLFDYHHMIPSENSYLFTLSYVSNKTDSREYKLLKVSNVNSEPSITIIENQLNLHWNSAIYDSIHQVYILINNFEITIMDSTFDNVLKQKTILENNNDTDKGYFYHINQSNNGQFIILTYSNQIYILRYDDLQVIRVENLPYACLAQFSDNNQYLLIGTWNNGYILENDLIE
ncbi:YncE family protein [Heyndrickxia sp. NPDC080065]|uniref:YncE family protein n=1 Tax=Heyndrickxia sp. NPDC080065 TaxID=3390568 RepID=UPI003CFC41A9